MSKNVNQSKQYRIYIKKSKSWVDVNKEFYTNYYRDINSYRKRQQEHGRCVCPANNRYLCDMDCMTCPYAKAGDQLSLNNTVSDGEAKLKGNGKSVPAFSVLKTPLRDGDLERPDDPAYAGSYFVNANATSAPGIVDADRSPILTRSEVYSGVYGRANISFYAFNSSGNKGIACGLNNLQKIRDGEPFGGKASAESDFATDDDDDFLD